MFGFLLIIVVIFTISFVIGYLVNKPRNTKTRYYKKFEKWRKKK